MKQFRETPYILCIVFVLVLSRAIPLYLNRLILIDPVLNWVAIPVLGDAIALAIAYSAHNRGVNLRLLMWIIRVSISAALLYLLLLIGSLFVGSREVTHWNTPQLVAAPIIITWYLFMSVVTGLIIRAPKQ